MKKLLLTMLTILSCGAAYALPTGNPADPLLTPNGLFWDDCYEDCYDPCDPCGFDWDVSLRVGYYGDFVYNRKLQLDGFSNDRIGRFEAYTNAGLIVLNFWERVDIFATLGATRFSLNSNSTAFGIVSATGSRLVLNTDTDFSWTVGANVVLWECGCTVIGLDGRYFRTSPDVRRVTIAESISVFPDDDVELNYHEWSVALGVAHRINMFVPYVAVKWNQVDVDFDGTNAALTALGFVSRDLQERHQWGYAVGVSLVDCDIMSLNVEGRFRDEKAVSVNAQIRF